MEQLHIATSDGGVYNVIGGAFWDMLQRVKAIPGRRYEQKVWVLPLTLEETREQLKPLRVVNEDDLLDAEIADIRRAQSRILELRDSIEQRIGVLNAEVSRYSRNSKSQIRYSKARDSALLSHALENAALPLEKLTEPQIKGMYAALREMEE